MAVATPPPVQPLPRVPDAPPPDLAGGPGDDSPARATVRFVCLALLLVLGLVRWDALLADASALRPVLFALAAAALAAGLALVPRRHPWLVVAATLAAVIGGLAASLLVAGVPLWMLDPRDWGSLAPGLADGINALPGVTVPYQGTGDWLRVVIGLGGLLLVVSTAVLAGLRRPSWSLVPLVVLLAVPAIQMSPDHPWLVGAAITVPLALYLLVGRLRGRLAVGAAAVLTAALLIGMAAGPLLDRADPAIDVQKIADALQPEQPDTFDWSHSYGPLDWPRDGRVLARIRSSDDRAAYWKTEDLEFFDGVGWRPQVGFSSPVPAAVGLSDHPGWKIGVRVAIGELSTREFIAPGDTLSVSRSPRQPVGTRPGGFSVAQDEDDLGPGDAYHAESYVPRPSARQLRASGVAYPAYVTRELAMFLPAASGGNARMYLSFAPFGSARPDYAYGPGAAGQDVDALLQQSGYGRVRALAQRLSADARTPFDVVSRVMGYLDSDRFTYREDVPEHRLPIPAFLFADRAGYCQHFSGAMALLLRMAGVPARVSAGFAPGQFDSDRGEYVVRDLDAHSWVEVWFNGIGWVTFDPTPTASPARSQTSGTAGALTGVLPGGPRPGGSFGGADLGPGGEAAPVGGGGGGGGVPWGLVVLGVVALGALVAAVPAWRWWSRRRTRDRGEQEEVTELARALRRTGRTVEPGTTLRDLERRFGADPGARDYIRALVRRRYAEEGAGPTPQQRAALRASLARGLGLTGRLRALWALPPRGLH